MEGVISGGTKEEFFLNENYKDVGPNVKVNVVVKSSGSETGQMEGECPLTFDMACRTISKEKSKTKEKKKKRNR